jgi:dihydrofolate synthase/folylpolyglutamate synthase
MGGRLDATNVVDEPLATVITPISDDHMEYLGDTIAKIAGEKAGIIKQNSPCIISWQLEEAMNVFKKKAFEMHAPIYACGSDWNFERTASGLNFMDLEEEVLLDLPKPSLHGIHQIMNAATAAATISVISGLGFNISYENVCNGLSKTFWPARLQKIENGVLAKMLPEGFELWVDGAHNNGGAQMLAATIDNEWGDKPSYMINGRTGNRDIKTFLTHFIGKIEFVCGVKVKSEPLGELAENITNGAREIGLIAYECEGVKEAIQLIIEKSSGPGRILICGSLYLAADVLLANKEL